MNASHYNPETGRYWFREIPPEAINGDVLNESARALGFFGADLGLDQPYPRIQWVRPEAWEIADEEDNRAAERERELGLPYKCDCFHEAVDFTGFTRYGQSDLIYIRDGLTRNQLIRTIADEMYHVWQDRQYGEEYREAHRSEAEADAENYAADAIPRCLRLFQSPKPEAMPGKDRAWFERKVTELKAELEKLPADRQEQFKRELEKEIEE